MKTTILLAALLASAACFADELADKGRVIYKKNQHSVVTVQLVLKSKMSMSGFGGQSSESRQDVTGTVVDPSGLTVLALSATDPGTLLQSMMGSGEDDAKFKMETELTDVKILTQDGGEIASEVVLRDKDLDLAFIRPKAKLAAPMDALDLNDAGKAEILDQVLSLNRLGNAAGRAYAASFERISAIVEKPRLFYVPETSASATSLGSPAFTLEGKPLGIFVMRALKSHGNSGGGLFGMQPDNMAAIIVPVKDIVKAVKQVPAAGEEKKKKETTTE